MAATREEIEAWLSTGLEKNSTHVIIVVDTWDYEDYPVYVAPQENVHEKVAGYKNSPDRVVEVYNLCLSLDKQLNQRRTLNY